MNRQEVAQLLTLASLIDNRVVGDEAVLAWHELVGGIDYDEAVQAMNDHHSASTDWLMPAHIIQRVQAARSALVPFRTTSPEAPEDCGAHRRLPDGTCMFCIHREVAS